MNHVTITVLILAALVLGGCPSATLSPAERISDIHRVRGGHRRGWPAARPGDLGQGVEQPAEGRGSAGDHHEGQRAAGVPESGGQRGNGPGGAEEDAGVDEVGQEAGA